MLLGLVGDQKEGGPRGGGIVTSKGGMVTLQAVLQRPQGRTAPRAGGALWVPGTAGVRKLLLSPTVPGAPTTSCHGVRSRGNTVPLSGSSSQNCAVARCLENNSQELQQLEGLVAQTKVSAQNHRVVEVGRDLWRSPCLVQGPCSSRVT